MTKKVIAQIGSFDVKNYGDLLFPVVLKNKLSDYEIDLFSPNGGSEPFDNKIKVFSLEELEQKIKARKYSALILGGGDIIRIDTAVVDQYKNNHSPALSLFVFPILLAKKYNIKVILNAPGVPFKFNENEKSIIKELLRDVDYIAVRGENSKNFLEECGASDVKIVPDTVLCISNIIKLSELKMIKRKIEDTKLKKKIDNYIIIQHNQYNNDNQDYIDVFKNFISLVTRKYKLNVVLLPIGYVHHDIKFLSKLVDANNDNVYLVEKELSPEEMLSIIANSKGYIGTSMHGAITTYAYKKPILMINTKYNSKRNEFLKVIGKPELEINSIYDLEEKFKKYFLNFSVGKLKICVKDIDNHFKKIISIINDEKNNYVSGADLNIIEACLVKLINNNENAYRKVKFYYDDNGFCEENTELIDCIYKNNQLVVENYFNKPVRILRLDPLEGDILKYKKISIYCDDKLCNDFEIPNLYYKDGYNYIWNIDPQIIINIPNDVRKIKIVIDDLSSISKEELFNYTNYLLLNKKNSFFEKIKKKVVNLPRRI